MTPGNVNERFSAVERVMRAARGEINRGCGDNAVLFLRAATRDIEQMTAMLEGRAEVVRLPRKEGR